MKPANLLKIAAISIAFVSSSLAQLVTYTTQPAYQGSVVTFAGGGTLGQTFTDVYAVAYMTFNFFAGTGSGGTVNTTTDLVATFGQWNGSGFVAGTTVDFGTISIPPSSAWTASLSNGQGTFPTYQVTFDLTDALVNSPVADSVLASPVSSSSILDPVWGYSTDPSYTYALMLTNSGGASNLGLGLTNFDAFQYGATNFNFNDWTFAQIAVATTNPVPEASTVAAMIGAAFIAGLVGLRIRQRRQLAALPAAPAAA